LHQQLQTVKDWQLWLVGDGPERSHYEKCAADLNVSGKVSFWGFQSDIKPFLWAADLFVQPSREPEGFSLMLLEAMAAGLPAIATGIGGTLDIIEDGNSGWLFNPGDAQGLKNILESLLHSEDLPLFSSKSQKRAEEFSVERIGAQTIDFYKTVIKQ
jgi:glycosyltransferase involved in cell wall biosynthesis